MKSPLDAYRPPKAPSALRQRTLVAAQAALAETHRPPSVFARWVDRLWLHRGLRLAWSAMVLLLLAVNILLSVLPSLPGPTSGSPLMAGSPDALEDPLRGVAPPLGLASLQDRGPTWGGTRNVFITPGSLDSLDASATLETLDLQEVF